MNGRCTAVAFHSWWMTGVPHRNFRPKVKEKCNKKKTRYKLGKSTSPPGPPRPPPPPPRVQRLYLFRGFTEFLLGFNRLRRKNNSVKLGISKWHPFLLDSTRVQRLLPGFTGFLIIISCFVFFFKIPIGAILVLAVVNDILLIYRVLSSFTGFELTLRKEKLGKTR